MTTPTPLLETVEGFLGETETPPTVLGRSALNDPNFVFDLRKGRRVWPETEEKVRAFIKNHTKNKTTKQDTVK